MNGGDGVPTGWKIPNHLFLTGIGFLVVLLCALGLIATHRATSELSQQFAGLQARLQSLPTSNDEVAKLSDQVSNLKGTLEAIPRADQPLAEIAEQVKQLKANLDLVPGFQGSMGDLVGKVTQLEDSIKAVPSSSQAMASLTEQVKQVEMGLSTLRETPRVGPDLSEAVKLGQDAIQKGNWQMGELYLINAVTNAPRDVQLLTNYTDTLVGQTEAVPATSLERLTSLLELASYQVDPASIPAVVSLLEKARTKLAGTRSRPAFLKVRSGL